MIWNTLSWAGKLKESSVWRALRWTLHLQASRDYIGMAVVDGQLRCVYNLGDREAELQVDQTLTESETQEAIMDRVKFQRYKSVLIWLTLTKLQLYLWLNPIFNIMALIFFFIFA